MSLLELVAEFQRREVPGAYRLAEWRAQRQRAFRVHGLADEVQWDARSGAFEIRRRPSRSRRASPRQLAADEPDDLIGRALLLAQSLDDRGIEQSYPDERAPENVRRSIEVEYEAYVEGVAPAGPGGRISLYRTRVEGLVRTREEPLGGWWQDPERIADSALESLGEFEFEGADLRAGFGYYEAPKSERQVVLRPVVVFMLESRRSPRWRVATVEAATDIDGAPPTAGIEAATGCV